MRLALMIRWTAIGREQKLGMGDVLETGLTSAQEKKLSGKQPGMHFLYPNGQRPLILVVDDLPENLTMLSEMVGREGAEVGCKRWSPTDQAAICFS